MEVRMYVIVLGPISAIGGDAENGIDGVASPLGRSYPVEKI